MKNVSEFADGQKIEMEGGILEILDNYYGAVRWSQSGDELDDWIYLIQAEDGKWLEGMHDKYHMQYQVPRKGGFRAGLDVQRSRFNYGQYAHIETAIRNLKSL